MRLLPQLPVKIKECNISAIKAGNGDIGSGSFDRLGFSNQLGKQTGSINQAEEYEEAIPIRSSPTIEVVADSLECCDEDDNFGDDASVRVFGSIQSCN
ncbi:hypothetical protein V6N13_087906 [Hibiscus sabdariffa]|uniref:Uncharacterized protein n=1 Tax=Hibiscus sabdariffa TaxID=183260 RepID=A0ABR2FXU4_9ROSI